MPTWLGQPETPPTAFATLNLPIFTPDPNASLLVTVYFQEKQGGFMRIIWQGTQDAQVLSDNFYEDIGMANQRSLLISPTTLVGDGVLTFQCGDSALGIQRIKLEWLENKNGLVSPEVQDLLVTPAAGPTQSARSLNGQANPTGPGAWQNQLVTVPITDQALRVEQGVEFQRRFGPGSRCGPAGAPGSGPAAGKTPGGMDQSTARRNDHARRARFARQRVSHRRERVDQLCRLARRVVLRARLPFQGGRQHGAIFRRERCGFDPRKCRRFRPRTGAAAGDQGPGSATQLPPGSGADAPLSTAILHARGPPFPDRISLNLI